VEDFIQHVLVNYGWVLYPIILVWTALEGETIVLFTGALAAEGRFSISIWALMAAAFCGSFIGDQIYFYIGKRYGTPLLKRWPKLQKRIEWAFRMVRTHETMFILTFRFIYGVRNISPFVIGMSGVRRSKFVFLNAIAAILWANTFAWGGYFLGQKLEDWLGEYKIFVLLGIICLLFGFAIRSTLKQRRKDRAEALLAAQSAPLPGETQVPVDLGQ